jgi:hypothetical protein
MRLRLTCQQYIHLHVATDYLINICTYSVPSNEHGAPWQCALVQGVYSITAFTYSHLTCAQGHRDHIHRARPAEGSVRFSGFSYKLR